MQYRTKGVVLISVLLIVLLLSSIAMLIGNNYFVSFKRAQYNEFQTISLNIFRNNESLALKKIDNELRFNSKVHARNNPLFLNDFFFELNQGSVKAKIIDAANCFNINSLVKQSKNKFNQPRVLQIGCAQGGDAVDIAQVLKLPMINGELHIIDWFKGNLTVDEEEEWYYREENAPIWRAHLESEAKKLNVEDRITIFEGDSREMIHKVKDGYYDFVFIDGGHEYDIVKSDIENGYKKLKPGGVLVLDDFTGGKDVYDRLNIKNATEEKLQKDTWDFNGEIIHVGVVKAVHEFLNGNYILCESHDKAYHIKGYKIERE